MDDERGKPKEQIDPEDESPGTVWEYDGPTRKRLSQWATTINAHLDTHKSPGPIPPNVIKAAFEIEWAIVEFQTVRFEAVVAPELCDAVNAMGRFWYAGLDDLDQAGFYIGNIVSSWFQSGAFTKASVQYADYLEHLSELIRRRVAVDLKSPDSPDRQMVIAYLKDCLMLREHLLEIGHPDTERVRGKLAEFGQGSAGQKQRVS